MDYSLLVMLHFPSRGGALGAFRLNWLGTPSLYSALTLGRCLPSQMCSTR